MVEANACRYLDPGITASPWLDRDEDDRGLMAGIERVMLGGFPTVRLDRAGLAQIMVEDCLRRRGGYAPPRLVFSSNGQGIALAGSDPSFADVMAEADMVHADGMSVVFASRWFVRKPLPERIATTDFFHDAARAGQPHGLRFYLLGATEEISAAAFARARQLYPGIQWVGRRNGYFSEADEPRICAEIAALRPDVLWVALGKPKQEFFCVRNRERLRGVGWLKTCGGALDFVAGINARAPKRWQDTGFEWAWRTLQEPRRLFWRYITTNIHATWRLLTRSRLKDYSS